MGLNIQKDDIILSNTGVILVAGEFQSDHGYINLPPDVCPIDGYRFMSRDGVFYESAHAAGFAHKEVSVPSNTYERIVAVLYSPSRKLTMVVAD